MTEIRTRLGLVLSGLVLTAIGCSAQNGGLVLQLKRRNGGRFARGLLKNATIPLHGAVKDYGYFYATIHLGSPPLPFAVIVDTGSTITYVPCKACGNACGPHHKDAAFDPSQSNSAKYVPCDSDMCSCGRPQCTCTGGKCFYSRSYAEQSSSAGVLLVDNLLLGDASVNVVFGCETKETGEIYNQEADGIFGLGNSEISIINQLASRGVISDMFSLCFGSVEGDGAFMVGDVDLSPYNVDLQYTPMIDSPGHPHYLAVGLEAIAVANKTLRISPTLFQQGFGTVLDSGTTFTYLPTAVFKVFTEEVAKFALQHGLRSIKGPDPKFDDICFGGAPFFDQTREMMAVFPTVSMTFSQGVTLQMGPLNYLFMHSLEKGGYCIGVFDNGDQGTLLGGITFRNILVQYDKGRRRVGFGEAHCAAIGQFSHLPPCQAGSPLPPGAQCAPTLPASQIITGAEPGGLAGSAVSSGALVPPTVAAPRSPAQESATPEKPANHLQPTTASRVLLAITMLVVAGLVIFGFVYAVRRSRGRKSSPGRGTWPLNKGGGSYRMFVPGGDQQLMPTGSRDSALFEGAMISNGSHGSAGTAGSKLNASATNGASGPGKNPDDSPTLPGTMIDIPLH